MHSILKMLILGVVQGATEFLPVSSSGHLTLMQDVLGITSNRVLLDVFLHVGTLMAILLVFGKDVVGLFSSNRRWIPYLAAASVPAAAVGLGLRAWIEKGFESATIVAGLLMANSVILAAGSVAGRRRGPFSEVRLRGAIVVGVAQSLAILPGISRSGSTVCSGLWMGWEGRTAVRFSFLLAIPAIMGAAGFEAVRCGPALASGRILAMGFAGLVVSAMVGYIALRIFLKSVERGRLWVFAGYCFVLGGAVLVYKLAA